MYHYFFISFAHNKVLFAGWSLVCITKAVHLEAKMGGGEEKYVSYTYMQFIYIFHLYFPIAFIFMNGPRGAVHTYRPLFPVKSTLLYNNIVISNTRYI